MFIINIFKKTINSWREYYFFFIIASIIGALNPFFFILVARALDKLLSFSTVINMTDYLQISIFSFILIAIQGFFPLSLMAMDLQRNCIQENVNGFKEFFKGIGNSFIRSIGPSIFLTVIYGILTLLFSYTGYFYFMKIGSGLVKYLMLTFVIFSYLTLMITQYFFALMFTVYKKLKFSEILKYSMEIAIRNFLPIFILFLIDFIILIFLTFLWKISLVFYFGISNVLRYFLYEEIIKKYEFPPQTRMLQKVKSDNSPQSLWVNLLEAKKARKEKQE